MTEQFFTIRNLDKPLMDTRIDGTLRQAIYVKLGMQALHTGDRIIIEDPDGYLVPQKKQKGWMINIIGAGA